MKRYLILLLFISSINLYSENNTLKWSSYIGGASKDNVEAVVSDDDGNIYIYGYTTGNNFPTTAGAFQRNFRGASDLFLMKFTKNMDLVWSTLIGGNDNEYPKYLTFHKNYLWVVSDSRSSNFPTTPDAFQPIKNQDYDGVLMKFSLDGKLLYSSFFGSDGYDVIDDIVVDKDENLWFTGRVFGYDFITSNDAEQKTHLSGADSYIAKFDKNGQMIYCSYLAGTGDDYAMDIAYNKNSNLIAITGYTNSYDFPIKGNAVFPKKIGFYGFDTFVSYFNMEGKLTYSTYFGGDGIDYGEHITNDNEGGFYFRSFTNSYDILKNYNTFQKFNPGEFSSYIAKINEQGEILWGTFYGGSDIDAVNNVNNKGGGLSVDKNDNISITGFTNSNNLPITKNALQINKSNQTDAYLCKISKNGDLIYSSYLGGEGDEEGRDVLLTDNKLIIVGFTSSTDFPITKDSFKNTLNDAQDGFISIFQLPQTTCDPVMDSEVGFTNLNLKTNRTISDDSYVHLTDFISYDNGYMFSKNQVNVSYGFVSNFSFTVSDGVVKIEHSDLKSNELQSDNSLPGADGIAFIIAGLIPNKEGGSGGGIGYDGMPNAIAIELDLYKNDENNDPNGNHLAVQIPNNFILSAVHNKTNTVIMKDSVLTIVPDSSTNYYCRVEYINNSLKIYLDTTENYNQPVAELDNFIISDHILMENDNIGYLGLTSSTGRSVEVHTITHWDICSYNSSSIATGITTNESNHSLLVYPNPTDDYLNIELPNGKPYKSLQLVISDLLGKIVMKREIANAQNTMQLSVRNFEKGLYNCQIILDNQEVYHTQLIRK